MNYGDLDELTAVYEPALAKRIYEVHLGVEENTRGMKQKDKNRYGYEAFRRAWPKREDFIANFYWIRSKTPGEVCLLRHNAEQKMLVDHIDAQEARQRPVRVIILKARQTGISTCVQGQMADRVLTVPHFRAAVIAHADDSATEIFEMTNRFMDQMPYLPPLRRDRASEIQTDWDSKYTCITAGSSNAGRALACHWVHPSEFAFYVDAESLYYGLMQTIPNRPGTGIIIESTANGMAGLFRELWVDAVAGKNAFFPLFIPWWQHAEYTLRLRKEEEDEIADTIDADERFLIKKFPISYGQLAWRRYVIANNCANNKDMFRQEYPSFADEAFLMSGRPVFDAHRIQELLGHAEPPRERGSLAWVN